MKQDLIDKILATTLTEEIKQTIINSLTERYVIKPVKAAIKMGDSKLGGFPHLPKDFTYPQEENFYYEFVAQINLSDLTDCNIPDFPQNGIMYFFIDDDFKVSDVNAKVFVLNPNRDDLEIKRPPLNKPGRCEAFLDRTEKTEIKLHLTKSYTIEQNLLDTIIDQNDGKEISTDGFNMEDLYTRNQVWGFTTTWGGGEAEWSAYLAKRRFLGLYWHTLEHVLPNLKKENIDFRSWLNKKVDDAIMKQKEILEKNDKSSYIYPYWEKELADLEFTKLNLDIFIDNFEHHRSESKNWKMLLSLSSDDDAQIKFGDGKMEFFIHAADLKNKKYDNVYCHIYN